MAQIILGPSCANVEVVPSGDASMDDDCEFFVTAWCLDPQFIPNEEVIFIPEPDSHLGGPLCLRPEEVIHDELPGLRYLVRLRLVEF